MNSNLNFTTCFTSCKVIMLCANASNENFQIRLKGNLLLLFIGCCYGNIENDKMDKLAACR